MSQYIPKWHRELDIFHRIKPLIILEGNVLDVYQYPEDGSAGLGSVLRLTQYLHYFLNDSGYQSIVFFDSLNGITNPCDPEHVSHFAHLVHASFDGQCVKADFRGKNGAAALAKMAVTQGAEASVVVFDFASRYIVSPDRLEQAEVDSYTMLLQASMDAREVKTNQGMMVKNLIIIVVNKLNDLPAWFYLQNPNVKTISLDTPAKEEREALVTGPNFRSFFDSSVYVEENGYYQEHPEELRKIQNRFVALTEGFSFTELNGLRRLCKNEQISMRDMCDVIDLYKYGIRENPWKSLDLSHLEKAEEMFEKRVKGQKAAITKTLDVIKRAATGMAGLQSSSHSKPKGVLFFAGPTGTGKTETAKTLSEILFGDEKCCIRFDMSEYGQSHSDQKLLGAPPGYVGYEAGGQLTNAVRKNPFSILLFDEIEKAHPSVLDKFLQILEDGRMTDGQGNTVYFSETVIIFTSNLGIYTRDASGVRHPNVTQNMNYPEVRDKVRTAIEEYFKLELGRPEILNRIGENIVVFDYIRDDVAAQILDSQIAKIVSNLAAEKRISLSVQPEAKSQLLYAAISNLANGGRGIGNIVESMLIDPLSRYMFDNRIFDNASIDIQKIDTSAIPTSIVCNQEA